MARPPRSPETPGLFDLPLNPEAEPSDGRLPEAAAEEPLPRPAAAPRPEAAADPAAAADSVDLEGPAAEAAASLPLFAGGEEQPGQAEEGLRAVPEPFEPRPAGVLERLQAGLADLAVHAAVGLTLLLGAEIMGARPGLAALAPVALFLGVFSLLYTVVPLAFWGSTPGMLWNGLAARSAQGSGLTVDQSARRWLATLGTVVLLGLPALLVLSGGSPADRLSGSRVLRNR